MKMDASHECTGPDCQHEDHSEATAPAEEAPACRACSGEEGAEHTCSM